MAQRHDLSSPNQEFKKNLYGGENQLTAATLPPQVYTHPHNKQNLKTQNNDSHQKSVLGAHSCK